MDLGVSSCESEKERHDMLEKAVRDDEHWVDLDDVNKTHVPPLSLHIIYIAILSNEEFVRTKYM